MAQPGVTVGGVVSSERAVQGNYGSINGQAVYTDRPTITYVPMTGEKFLRGKITLIDPKNIFFMLQAGYPADFILGLTVESLNGVRNRSAAVLFFQRDDLSADMQGKSVELRRLLRLQAEQQKFVLTYSPMRGAGNELAVNSRSLLQILQAFSSYIEVPEQDLRDKIVAPAFAHAEADPREVGRIRSGPTRPETAYVTVQYRGNRFWVEDSDWLTKRALTAVMFFFTLADTGSPDRLPLITIPAQ